MGGHSDTTLEADLLIVGAGMAGLTVAATARQAGASVIIAEAGRAVGGSAAMSAGLIWTAADAARFLQEDPDGDVDRFRVVRDEFADALNWVEDVAGTPHEAPLRRLSDLRVGTHADIHGFLDRCASFITSGADSWLFTQTSPVRLLMESGIVRGATILNHDAEETADVRARVTVLATGGFQGDARLRREYLGPGAEHLFVRANPHSRGAGLKLGLAAGAATSGRMDSFYGHLMPHPWPEPRVADFRAFAQKQSDFGLLVDDTGRRFTDESLGDQKSNLAVRDRGHAILIVDEQIRREQMPHFDRMEGAAPRGARFATADTLATLGDVVRPWGYDSGRVRETVQHFNDHVETDPDALPTPRGRHRRPLTPPLSVLEVQAGITFTYGGLLTDLDGRVLRDDGSAVAGLFAAGVDAGGLNIHGYTGGLSRSLVLGRRTARAALEALSPA